MSQSVNLNSLFSDLNEDYYDEERDPISVAGEILGFLCDETQGPAAGEDPVEFYKLCMKKISDTLQCILMMQTDTRSQVTYLRQDVANVTGKMDKLVSRTDSVMTHMEKMAGMAITIPVAKDTFASNIKPSDKASATRNLVPGFCYSCIKLVVESSNKGYMMSTAGCVIKYLVRLFIGRMNYDLKKVSAAGCTLSKDAMFNMSLSTVSGLMVSGVMRVLGEVVESLLCCFLGPMSPFITLELYEAARTTRIDWNKGTIYEVGGESKHKSLIGPAYEKLSGLLSEDGNFSKEGSNKGLCLAMSSFDWSLKSNSYISLAGCFIKGLVSVTGEYYKNVDIKGIVMAQDSKAIFKQHHVAKGDVLETYLQEEEERGGELSNSKVAAETTPRRKYNFSSSRIPKS